MPQPIRSKQTSAVGTVSTIQAGGSAAIGSADGLARADHTHAVATAVASALTMGAGASEGSSSSLARADHVHSLNETGTIATINAGDAAVGGSATGIARRDHQHAVATGGSTSQIVTNGSAGEGSSSNLAREDHTHAVSIATPTSIGAANAAGSSTSFVRADHVHAHGNQGGGTLHAEATQVAPGFMSAADKAKLDGIVSQEGFDVKESVRAATDAAGTLATSFENGDTLDGVTLVTNDRILIKDQTNAVENGIYIVQASGAPTRASDFNSGSDQAGAFVFVEEGSSNADTGWVVSSDGAADTVGTHNITWVQFSGSSTGIGNAGAGLTLSGSTFNVGANGDGSITVNADDIQVGILASDAQHGARGGGTQHAAATTSVNGFMSSGDKTKLDNIASGATANVARQQRIVGETITNSDSALSATLAQVPISNDSVKLFLNGVLQDQGAGNDYTIAGQTITWLANTGSAVDMDTTDDITVVYESAA